MLSKPAIWWPGCNVDDPLCPDFCWPMWEGGGTSKVGCVGKRVGNPYDYLGTLTEMDPATDWVATEMGWALDFSAGKDRKVVLPGFSLSGNWTSAFWMWGAENNPGGATGSMVCGKDSDDDFIYCADNLRTRFENSVGANVSWVADNDFYHRWRHCLFAADATGITFYLDGISQGRQAIAPTLALDLLGVAHTNPVLDFTGRLASFTLWNRCLLAADAQDLYADPFAMLRLRREVFPAAVAPSGNPWYTYAQQVA